MSFTRFIVVAALLSVVVGCGSNNDAEVSKLKAEAEMAKAQADAVQARHELELEKARSANKSVPETSTESIMATSGDALRRMAEREVIDVEREIVKLQSIATRLAQLEQKAKQLEQEGNQLPSGVIKALKITEAAAVAAERTSLMVENQNIPRQIQTLEDRLADARKRALP